MTGGTGSNWPKVFAMTRLSRQRATTDRRFLFVAGILPFVIILLVGSLVGNINRVPLGVIQLDHGPLADRLVSLLERSDAVKVSFAPSTSQVRDKVLRGLLAGGIEIPADFDAALQAGQVPVLDEIGQVGAGASAQARAAVVGAVDVVDAEWQAALQAHQAHPDISVATALDSAQKVTDAAYGRVAATTTPKISPYSYTTPANLILFVFLTALVSASALVESRQLGLLQRILASPTPPWVIVVAQLISTTVLALAQSVGMIIMGSLVFGVHWGDPVALALLVVVLSLAASGGAVVLGTFCKSQEQAISIGTVGGISLAMLGGCMWPLDVVGPVMREVGHVTPQAWAMDGFVHLVYDHSGIAGVAPDLGVLAAMGLGLLLVGTYRLRSTIAAR